MINTLVLSIALSVCAQNSQDKINQVRRAHPDARIIALVKPCSLEEYQLEMHEECAAGDKQFCAAYEASVILELIDDGDV